MHGYNRAVAATPGRTSQTARGPHSPQPAHTWRESDRGAAPSPRQSSVPQVCGRTAPSAHGEAAALAEGMAVPAKSGRSQASCWLPGLTWQRRFAASPLPARRRRTRWPPSDPRAKTPALSGPPLPPPFLLRTAGAFADLQARGDAAPLRPRREEPSSRHFVWSLAGDGWTGSGAGLREATPLRAFPPACPPQRAVMGSERLLAAHL